MIYRLLGELQIGPDDGLAHLPSGPTLIILADLLMHANKRVSKIELIRVAWGKDDVNEAQLHKRVNAIRKMLTEVGHGDDLKTHARFGYELRTDEADLDTLLFNRLVAQAQQAREEGTEGGVDEEIRLLRAALRLWRGGPPLSNVPSDAFYAEIAELMQRRKHAAVRLFELEISRGHHELILDELSAIAGQYPADQRLTEQLMVAAYHCGHPADVGTTYERYRKVIDDETAGSPDHLVKAFHFAVARGDDATAVRAESAMAKRAGTSMLPVLVVPRQLPPAVALVGRQALVAATLELLGRTAGRTAPVVAISGPGGIGKTALAVTVAHELADHYPDGQLYAQLHGTGGGPADTAEVLAQFLRALGMPLVPEAKQERLMSYRSLLAERRVLIVLDDAVTEEQVNDLIPASSGCAVLITARQRLPGTSAFHVPPLEPLGQQDATELFLSVLRDAGIGPDDDPAALARVVCICGGLPLALRIVAALRVRDNLRPAEELARRLAEQGPEAFAYGELSVARSIGAGLDRLSLAARRLFLGLGLLSLAGFGQWTAAAVLGDPDASDALHELAATFMIEPGLAGTRYRFHELTREYAARRGAAEQPGDRVAVPDRVYRALLTLARRAHSRLYGGDFEVVHSEIPDWDAPPEALAEVDASPIDWFEKERENIRLAIGHAARLGLSSLCWDLAVSAHEFYTIRAYFDDWRTVGGMALQACQAADDQHGEGIMLTCLNQPALVSSRRAAGASSVAELERAVDLLAGYQDRHGQAIALRTLASALRRQGHLRRPLALFREARDRYTACGDTVGRWQCTRLIGQIYLDLGRLDDARQLLGQAEAVAAELGGGRLLAQTRYWMGQVHLAMGNLAAAADAFGTVSDLSNDAAGLGRAHALHGLGDVAGREGAYQLADSRLAEAASLARDGHDAVLEGRVWLSVAILRKAEERADEQVQALEQAVVAFAGCEAAYLEAQALAELARAQAELGDPCAAEAAWRRVTALHQEAGIPPEDRIQSPQGS